MKTKLWFKTKTHGWGWTPATWEGWAVIVVYTFIFIWLIRSIKDASSINLYFFLKVLLLVATLIAISYTKGEKPRWRWGKE
jgi:hypothetical protein